MYMYMYGVGSTVEVDDGPNIMFVYHGRKICGNAGDKKMQRKWHYHTSHNPYMCMHIC